MLKKIAPTGPDEEWDHLYASFAGIHNFYASLGLPSDHLSFRSKTSFCPLLKSSDIDTYCTLYPTICPELTWVSMIPQSVQVVNTEKSLTSLKTQIKSCKEDQDLSIVVSGFDSTSICTASLSKQKKEYSSFILKIANILKEGPKIMIIVEPYGISNYLACTATSESPEPAENLVNYINLLTPLFTSLAILPNVEVYVDVPTVHLEEYGPELAFMLSEMVNVTGISLNYNDNVSTKQITTLCENHFLKWSKKGRGKCIIDTKQNLARFEHGNSRPSKSDAPSDGGNGGSDSGNGGGSAAGNPMASESAAENQGVSGIGDFPNLSTKMIQYWSGMPGTFLKNDTFSGDYFVEAYNHGIYVMTRGAPSISLSKDPIIWEKKNEKKHKAKSIYEFVYALINAVYALL